jgi:hypothetical protein
MDEDVVNDTLDVGMRFFHPSIEASCSCNIAWVYDNRSSQSKANL